MQIWNIQRIGISFNTKYTIKKERHLAMKYGTNT